MNIIYKCGRAMQLGGMIILPIAVSGNVAEKLDLKQSLMLSTLGMLLFLIGWWLQESAKPK